MTGIACGAGNTYPSGAPVSTLLFIEVHLVLSFVSPYFMRLSRLLGFVCSLCWIVWYLYFYLVFTGYVLMTKTIINTYLLCGAAVIDDTSDIPVYSSAIARLLFRETTLIIPVSDSDQNKSLSIQSNVIPTVK